MPKTSESIFRQIGANETTWESLSEFGKTAAGSSVGTAEPLFVRLDEKKMLETIEKSMPAPKKEEKKADKKEEKLPEISIEDFAKLELKVGLVLESERVEGADKLLVSKIKIGDEVRQIVSGIAKAYPPEEFVGKKVIVVTNLKPVKLRGVLSEGMILAAADNNGLSVLALDKDMPDGTLVR